MFDGLFYVKEGDKIFSEEHGSVGNDKGVAAVPKGKENDVIESAEECPGECIMIEPDWTQSVLYAVIHYLKRTLGYIVIMQSVQRLDKKL